MYIKLDENNNIINMDELLSYVRQSDNTSSLITLLSELQNLLNKKQVKYESASELQISIKAQIDAINAGYMSGKRYVNLPTGKRPTVLSDKEGTINIILLISGILTTIVMYGLLIFTRFIK